MICSIHQPNYLPWIGYFHKIALSDVFIFYDTTQYTKGDYRNRNQIKGPNGAIQLSLPVSFHLGDPISQVRFQKKILNKHAKSIMQAYSKAPFFHETLPLIEEIYAYDGDLLSDFDIFMIKKISDYLELSTEFVRLSESSYSSTLTSTEALVDICHHFQASQYIVGGDASYMDNSLFNDVQLRCQNFRHPHYTQQWGDFIPYMSIIDLICNEGTNSKNIILSSSY